METWVVFVVTFLFFTTATSSLNQTDCKLPSKRCNVTGPEIRFPFWIKGQQPEHCGYPGFAVSCSNATNETLLKLPFSGSFSIRGIDYKSQTLDIYDPHDFLPQRLFHLNFTSSPFLQEHQQPDDLESITFFNCSTTKPERDLRGSYGGNPISYLGVPGHQVYALRSSISLSYLPLSFCKKIKTIFEINETSFYVKLSWSQPSCGGCEAKGRYCKLKNASGVGPETDCFPVTTSAFDASAKRTLIGVTVGLVLLAVAILMFTKLYRDYRLDKVEKENRVRILKFLDDYKSLKPSRYTYADIKVITNQFKEKLGEGGYGSVYKGKLSNEILVAVKVLDNSTGVGEDFISEVGTIGRIHHVNVVRLVGFCADGYRRALVYEFLPNGSLEKFIFSRESKRAVLGWEKLQDIAIGIAKGIEYLHQGCELRILHFDIKPHNVLLDDHFNPKISDFGLAKLFPKDESAISMTKARGTIGYIAPEVFSRNFGHVSHKSDVYSFGIMLLEMVGGRKNIDNTAENTSQVYFAQWVYNHLSHGKELEIRIDEDGDVGIANKLTIVALWCIQWYPVDRPSMNVVVQMLEGDRETLSMPPNPFESTMPSNSDLANNVRPLNITLPSILE